MSVELEQEAMDVAQWWAHNRDTAMDVDKRLEFLIKVNDHLLWLLGRAVQDIKNLEHREKSDESLRQFILPKGIKFHDGLRVRS